MKPILIPLKDVARGEIVDAQFLDNVTEEQLKETENYWRSEFKRLRTTALVRGVSSEELPLQHDHWNWARKKKKATPESRFFGLYCQERMQGLMQITPGQSCQIAEQSEQLLVYIDYIEIAPWNLPGITETPQYRGIGSFFIEAAINFSKDSGSEGRIGLHSLEQAEQFYRRCDMTDCGMQKIGYSLSKYRYFEMTPDQAKRFVEGE